MTRRAASVLLGALGLLLLVSLSSAFGAPSIRSNPPAGSVQDHVPAEVAVQFADAQARSSHLEVADPCGKRVDAHVSTVSGRRVATPISATASGKYVVRYFGIASVSGHDTQGSFSFRVRGVEGCEAADVPAKAKPGRGIWDLPKADYALALGIAAVIGALGGLVYASILGPKA
jgi:methionine-rich copper-binding protein CopC